MVLGVPGLQVGQRADAVDAGVGPEVDQHDLPRSPASVSGRPPGVLNQRWLPANSGAVPSTGRLDALAPSVLGSDPVGFRGRGELRLAAQLVQPRLHGVGLLQAAGQVEVGDVRGNRLLQADVDVEHHDHGRGDHHGAHRALDDGHAVALAQRLQQAAAAEHQQQQDDRRADRVGAADQDRLAARRSDRDDGGEDRARARDVEEAERRTDAEARPEAVAARLRPEPAEARQGSLEPVGDAGREQDETAERQHGDRDVARDVGAQADAVEHLGQPDDRHGERHREAGDDPQRAAPAARRAGGQQCRQHGQHARADGGRGAGDEGEEGEQEHAVTEAGGRITSWRFALGVTARIRSASTGGSQGGVRVWRSA